MIDLNETMEMLKLLPKEDQELVEIFVKKLVLAWDSDFTKLSAQEKTELDEVDRENLYSHEEVWK